MFGMNKKNKEVRLADEAKLPLNAKNLFTFLVSKILQRLDKGVRVTNMPVVQKVEQVNIPEQLKETIIKDFAKEFKGDGKEWLNVNIRNAKDLYTALATAVSTIPSYKTVGGAIAAGTVDEDGQVWVHIKSIDGSLTIDAYVFQDSDGNDIRALVDKTDKVLYVKFPSTQNVEVTSSALPTGASTEATLAAVKAVLDSLDGKITKADTDDVTITNMPSVTIGAEVVYTTVKQTRLAMVAANTWYTHTLDPQAKFWKAWLAPVSGVTYDYDYDFTDTAPGHANYMSKLSGSNIEYQANPTGNKVYFRTAENNMTFLIEEWK